MGTDWGYLVRAVNGKATWLSQAGGIYKCVAN